MRVALTGTPGVGKSTLAALLRNEGRTVIDLADWADDHQAITGTDADGTRIIDTDALDVDAMPADCVIDSHMAHLLDVDVVWVVRCDPKVLRGRLEARGYAETKVQENLEAEAMDLILQEAMDLHDAVVQRDGTDRDPAALLASFQAATTGTLKGPDLDSVDWSDRLLEGI